MSRKWFTLLFLVAAAACGGGEEELDDMEGMEMEETLPAPTTTPMDTSMMADTMLMDTAADTTAM